MTPEASRTVAGGPSEASDRRTCARVRRQLRQELRSVSVTRANPRNPTRLLPESVNASPLVSGGRSLRSDRRLPYVSPPGTEQRSTTRQPTADTQHPRNP